MTLVAWKDVPPGSVVWDASPEFGGDSHVSIAVRFPTPDDHGREGAWTVAHGNPTYSASGGWVGTVVSASKEARPLVPDFAWSADFLLAREDGKVKLLTSGLTAAECASLGSLQPHEVTAWVKRRKALTPSLPPATPPAAVLDAADEAG